MFLRMKANLAPLYRTELDRHLYATASPHPGHPRFRNESARRQWLEARWKNRFAAWRADSQPRTA